MSLDVYFERREKSVGFAKMDVEGSEYRALMGMRQVIEESKKIDLITEFNPSALTRAGTDPTDYLKLLLKFDFQLSEIDEVRRRTIPLRESHFEELQSIPTLVNILCRRQKWEYTTIQVLYPFMAYVVVVPKVPLEFDLSIYSAHLDLSR